MKLLRKRDIPEERYSNAFLGYGPEESNFAVELTYSKASHSWQWHYAFFDNCLLYFRMLQLLYFPLLLSDYGVDKYDIGTGFGHFGIAIEDVSCS